MADGQCSSEKPAEPKSEESIITADDIEDELLKGWISNFPQEKLKITKEEDRHDSPTYKIHFYTDKHAYHISAVVGHYLGCILINRAPWPGEDHTRGSDFPDGKYQDSTWLRIVHKILSHEMLKIYKPK